MFLGMPTYKASNSIGHEKYLSYTERCEKARITLAYSRSSPCQLRRRFPEAIFFRHVSIYLCIDKKKLMRWIPCNCSVRDDKMSISKMQRVGKNAIGRSW